MLTCASLGSVESDGVVRLPIKSSAEEKGSSQYENTLLCNKSIKIEGERAATVNEVGLYYI
jgi:hypothetical protein